MHAPIPLSKNETILSMLLMPITAFDANTPADFDKLYKLCPLSNQHVLCTVDL